MNAVSYAKSNLEQNFNLLGMTMQGIDESQYNWAPAGSCNPAAKSHVHILTAVDLFINGICKGGTAKWPEFAAKHELPTQATEIWKHDKSIPLSAIQEYGEHVQKDALDYVASLSDADLDRELDTKFFGKQSLAWVLQLTGMHTAGHAGDIAAVKGMQGLKGLPF
jgi:hypothetical protein